MFSKKNRKNRLFVAEGHCARFPRSEGLPAGKKNSTSYDSLPERGGVIYDQKHWEVTTNDFIGNK